MTIPSLTAFIYSILLLIGGIIGAVKSHSQVSLLMGAASALFMGLSGFFIMRNELIGYRIGIATSLLLFIFFSYRYWDTHKIMPPAIFSVLSLIVLLILFYYRRPWN